MLLIELQGHPFNYAYPVQNTKDVSVLNRIYNWTCQAYGSNYPMPEILVVNHEHMQRAAKKANHHTVLWGDVYGWFSQQYDKVFISDQIKPSRSKKEAALLVHEFVHYLQTHDGKELDVDALEAEADQYMMKFLQNG